MAVIWQKMSAGDLYEVRKAGNSIRLYTNGVFHSQYNPSRPVTGSIWDLLLIPAFFYPEAKLQRILILGVGGGAVMRQLEYFLSPREIVGIELNKLHIYIARRFFGIKSGSRIDSYSKYKKNKSVKTEIFHANAIDWLKKYKGPRFDLIIDDLFGEKDGGPVRAVSADAFWFNKLTNHLSDHGMLVFNFISRMELRQSAYFTQKATKKLFRGAFQFSAPQYENTIGAFLRAESSGRIFRERLSNYPELNPDKKSCRLRYNMSRIIV